MPRRGLSFRHHCCPISPWLPIGPRGRGTHSDRMAGYASLSGQPAAPRATRSSRKWSSNIVSVPVNRSSVLWASEVSWPWTTIESLQKPALTVNDPMPSTTCRAAVSISFVPGAPVDGSAIWYRGVGQAVVQPNETVDRRKPVTVVGGKGRYAGPRAKARSRTLE
jgi:hypothetical protein